MTSTWLEQQGVTPQLAARYKKSHWIRPLGRGAWIRSEKELDWRAAVYALQTQLQIKVYPCGKSALELLGRGHYIPMGMYPPIQLSIPAGEKLPAWFERQPFAANLTTFNSAAVFNPIFTGLTQWEDRDYSIKISTPERAILELCHLLPKRTDTEEVKLLMEGLPSLRAPLLQKVLQDCQSIKAKRLFLVLAELSGHPWFDDLHIEALDLGKGKRTLPIKGKLHPRFKVTVPDVWIQA